MFLSNMKSWPGCYFDLPIVAKSVESNKKGLAINNPQASLGGRQSLRWSPRLDVEMQIPTKNNPWGAARRSLGGGGDGSYLAHQTDPDGFRVIGWSRWIVGWIVEKRAQWQDERRLWELRREGSTDLINVIMPHTEESLNTKKNFYVHEQMLKQTETQAIFKDTFTLSHGNLPLCNSHYIYNSQLMYKFS